MEILAKIASISKAPSIQRILRMQLLFKQPEGYSVHEINQLLRGHIYLYTDFLMINKYQNVSDITLAIEYYYQNIQFLVEFLSNIAAHFQEVTIHSSSFYRPFPTTEKWAK